MIRPSRTWRSRLVARAWAVSTVSLFLAGGGLVYATVGEVRQLTRPLPARPPEVKSEFVVRRAEDSLGRGAGFRIMLFSDEFRWRLNSAEELDNGPSQPRFTAQMRAVLNDAKEIICVGLSSEEVVGGVPRDLGRASEERRAARRAEQIARWVRSSLSRPVPVRKLNMGHHVPTGRARDTSDQRRVVIILVLNRDEGTNIDQALRAAMARESVRSPIFDDMLTKYSLAAGMASLTWVD